MVITFKRIMFQVYNVYRDGTWVGYIHEIRPIGFKYFNRQMNSKSMNIPGPHEILSTINEVKSSLFEVRDEYDRLWVPVRDDNGNVDHYVVQHDESQFLTAEEAEDNQ